MRTFTCVAAVIAIALTGAQGAYAGAEAGQGYFSAMASYIDDDKDRGVEDAVNGGQIGVGYVINDAWNVEGIVTAAAPETTLDEEHLGLGVDLQRVFRRDERFSPYLHAGIGYFKVDPGGAVGPQDGPMLSAGAGFLLDLFDSNVALRAEWKHRLDSAYDSDLHDNLWSLGLHIPFGAKSAKWTDSDGDGVEDGSDRCPNTPAGAKVDAYGCEIVVAPPQDSDGDGVTDDRDECPGTPAGARVDAQGCELDDDADGVVNRLDECPGTPAGVQVDIKGCEIKDVVTLRGVNFETNSDRLRPGATGVLDDVVASLKKNPTIKIEIAGHTDSDGSAAYNENLSARRAQTVYDYLANNGIAEDRMTSRGYGESEPVADNSTAAGKAQNRRVELRITDR